MKSFEAKFSWNSIYSADSAFSDDQRSVCQLLLSYLLSLQTLKSCQVLSANSSKDGKRSEARPFPVHVSTEEKTYLLLARAIGQNGSNSRSKSKKKRQNWIGDKLEWQSTRRDMKNVTMLKCGHHPTTFLSTKWTNKNYSKSLIAQ